ncbi:MAG: fibronectin type III domain-containing protein [Candidatus Kerfeldbacteria bacterium]|nr:fibronectin type III domain-containing protein [Candidatus Kerfeldbacteria bacterium]
MKRNHRTVRTEQIVEEKIQLTRVIAVAFVTAAIFASLVGFIALLLPAAQPGGANIVGGPSGLIDVLDSTTYRTRTFMIGYGPADNYTNTLGWQNIGQNYTPHIGCRGLYGAFPPGLDSPDVRVDDYHAANPDGRMLAYENTNFLFRAPSVETAHDETGWVHVHDPARLRLLPGDNRVRVLWSDDGRGFGGAYTGGNTYLRGENVSLTGYSVQRATNPNGPFTTLNGSPVAYKRDTPSVHLDTGMEFLDATAANGTTYYYRIVSLEGATELTFSEVAAARPSAGSPASLAVSSLDTRETLNFDAGVWTYTLTFVVEGLPDTVTLSFDRDRDSVIEDDQNPLLDETIALTETIPGSGKYVFTTTAIPQPANQAPGWGFFVTAAKGATTVRAPESDWYTTTINNRAMDRNYGWMIFARNNLTFRNWFASRMALHVSAADQCDGTFGDVVSPDVSALSDVPIRGFNSTQWLQDTVDWLAALDQPEYGAFVLNICPTRSELETVGPVSDKKLGEVGDGFLCEGFAASGGVRQWTGWLRGGLESAITAAQTYLQPVFIAPRFRDDASADGIRDREYGVAAYNLVREDRTYFYGSDESSSPVYEWPGDYPENVLHLGEPTDRTADGTITVYQMGQNYPQNALLRRRFVNGAIAMNALQPGFGTDQTIQLGGSYYRVLFRGGKVRDAGFLEVSQAPQTSVTLGPAEAAVFVTAPELPVCIESWACSNWSACLNSQQTRTCTDSHECGTTLNRPPLTQACDSTPPLISNVRATDITETTAIIRWTTNEAATSRVEYGLTPSYGTTTVEDPLLVTDHAVLLAGLTAGTTYHYRVHSVDGSLNVAASGDQTLATTVCSENWVCTPWGLCLNGEQTRTCVDQNACGTTNNRPPLTQACDATPPVIGDVTVTDLTQTTAIVRWTTDEPATSHVEFGQTVSYGQASVETVTLSTVHAVTLTDLSRGTLYHFRVRSRDAAENAAISGDSTFVTTTCTESWVCTPWSECSEGQQTRTCTDLNSCGTTNNRPPLTQACDSIPPGIAGATVEHLTPTSTRILWTTDEPATSQVEYGVTEQYGSMTTPSPVFVTSHDVTLSGLASAQTYHFRVRSSDGSGNEAVSGNQTFTTLAALAPPGSPPENPPVCAEQWSCTPWSVCDNGVESRACVDNNNCGTTDNRPAMSQECGAGGSPVPQPTELLFAPAKNAAPLVKRYRADGRLLSQFSPYAKSFRGGVTVSSGDFNGDGQTEIVTGTGANSSPDVRIVSRDGRILGQFTAFSRTGRTGASVVGADLNGDGQDEVVVAPLTGVVSLRAFRYTSRTRRFGLLTQTLAVPGAARGGLHLAAADFDGDGRDEIVVTPAASDLPRVSIFRYNEQTNTLVQTRQFLALPSSFRSGLSVAAGDVTGDGVPEIIIGAGPDRDPVVRFFSANGRRLWGFLAYNTRFRGGVVVGAVQADSDTALEVVTGPWSDNVSTTNIRNVSLSPGGQSILRRVTPYSRTFRNGVRIGGF